MTPEESFALLEAQVQAAFLNHRKRLEKIVAKEGRPSLETLRAQSDARKVRALTMRRQGKLLREIGAELGVGMQQARMMVKSAERMERRAGDES